MNTGTRGGDSMDVVRDVGLILAEPERVTLVVQPIIDTRSGLVSGYEVLTRFLLDVRRGPDVVFAAAAEAGLGPALEALVIGRALTLWREVPANCFLTINVDPAHLLRPEVEQLLMAEPTLDGVVLELTEHRLFEDGPSLNMVLDRLRKRGALIAVDDAGSGYSGLKRLLEIRPQFVKLDRELITDIHDDDAKRALVQMLGELASHLDASVIAEGIETEAELRVLVQLGVPLAQGYFLARPSAPWADLEPRAHAALTSWRSHHIGGTVRELLEPCPIGTDLEVWPEASVVVQVDGEGRPQRMRCTVAGHREQRDSAELMRVKAEWLLPEVARRAMVRPERLRWDPVLCVDETGHLIGLLRINRLVASLAGDNPQALIPPVPISRRAPFVLS
jgi:EAL domain-containing protein (putative c-di-GMP-specific phosphodiesterase class I)